jgi:hypothetical protein
MGTDNVISLAQRRAAKLAAQISSPAMILQPLEDETVDEFIERVGAAIAELVGTDVDGRASGPPPAAPTKASVQRMNIVGSSPD